MVADYFQILVLPQWTFPPKSLSVVKNAVAKKECPPENQFPKLWEQLNKQSKQKTYPLKNKQTKRQKQTNEQKHMLITDKPVSSNFWVTLVTTAWDSQQILSEIKMQLQML